MASKRSRFIVKGYFFVLSLVPLGWLVFAIWSDTENGTRYLTSDPTQKLNRELGDWALIFIIITLAVRPLAEIVKKPELVAYRRMLGLFAFFYALLHLSSYIAIDLQFDLNDFIKDVIKRNFITIGMIVFAGLLALAITSNKAMIKRLGGRRWRKLHMLIYPLAALAVLHFYMMVRADFTRPFTYGGIIGALLLYRVWKWRQKSGRKSSPKTEAGRA